MTHMEAVEKELECAICGGTMIDPRALTCQHCFCLRCLHQLSKGESKYEIKCPLGCDEPTVGDDTVTALARVRPLRNLCVAIRKRHFDPTTSRCDWCDSGPTDPLGTDLGVAAAAPEAAAAATPPTETVSPPVAVEHGHDNEHDAEEAPDGEDGESEEAPREPAAARAQMTLCDSCGSYICEACALDNDCVHSTLCCVREQESRKVLEDMERIPNLFMAEDAAECINAALLEHRPGLKVSGTVAQVSMLRVFETTATVVWQTQEGKRRTLKLEALAMPLATPANNNPANVLGQDPAALDLKAELSLPTAETNTLFEVRTVVQFVSDQLSRVQQALDVVKRAIRMSATAEEVMWFTVLLTHVDHAMQLVAAVLRPQCHDVVVLATLCGYLSLAGHRRSDRRKTSSRRHSRRRGAAGEARETRGQDKPNDAPEDADGTGNKRTSIHFATVQQLHRFASAGVEAMHQRWTVGSSFVVDCRRCIADRIAKGVASSDEEGASVPRESLVDTVVAENVVTAASGAIVRAIRHLDVLRARLLLHVTEEDPERAESFAALHEEGQVVRAWGHQFVQALSGVRAVYNLWLSACRNHRNGKAHHHHHAYRRGSKGETLDNEGIVFLRYVSAKSEDGSRYALPVTEPSTGLLSQMASHLLDHRSRAAVAAKEWTSLFVQNAQLLQRERVIALRQAVTMRQMEVDELLTGTCLSVASMLRSGVIAAPSEDIESLLKPSDDDEREEQEEQDKGREPQVEVKEEACERSKHNADQTNTTEAKEQGNGSTTVGKGSNTEDAIGALASRSLERQWARASATLRRRQHSTLARVTRMMIGEPRASPSGAAKDPKAPGEAQQQQPSEQEPSDRIEASRRLVTTSVSQIRWGTSNINGEEGDEENLPFRVLHLSDMEPFRFPPVVTPQGSHAVWRDGDAGSMVEVSLSAFDAQMTGVLAGRSTMQGLRGQLEAAALGRAKTVDPRVSDAVCRLAPEAPRVMLLPVVTGMYRVAQFPDQVFEFSVSAVGLTILRCEIPPLRGSQALLDRAHGIVRSPVTFFAVHGIVLAALVSIDFALKMAVAIDRLLPRNIKG